MPRAILSGFIVVALVGVIAFVRWPRPDVSWTVHPPEAHDRSHVASEIRQDARPPLIGLPFRDTLIVQCRKDGAVRMVLNFHSAVPHTNNPQHVWQPPPIREMTYRIDQDRYEAVTFTYEVFRYDPYVGGLSYRYVADARTEPRFLPALENMSKGWSMRRFDMAREPRYRLSPKIGRFLAACRPLGRQTSLLGPGRRSAPRAEP